MEQNQGLPDDFAAQEAAARTWEPEVEVRYLPFPSRPHPAFLGFPRLTTPDPHQGPLLGDKTTIAAITEQYAKADPIYVDKTIVSIP